MTRARIERGRQSEFIVAEDLKRLWPGAYATNKSAPGVDVAGVDPLELEIKATVRDPLLAALRQAEARTKGGIPVVVHRPVGYGPARLPEWIVAMSYATFFDRVAKDAGYHHG